MKTQVKLTLFENGTPKNSGKTDEEPQSTLDTDSGTAKETPNGMNVKL
jgi:hypothetical protein